MARPERHDADYFPFYCKNGATFSVLRQRMGPLGIGLFTELLIVLTTTPRHHVRIETEPKKQIFAARIGSDWKTVKQFIDVLVLTEKIHVRLWNEAGVLYCPDHVDSLTDAYSKRNTDPVVTNELEEEFLTGKKPKKKKASAPETIAFPKPPPSGFEQSPSKKIDAVMRFWNQNRPEGFGLADGRGSALNIAPTKMTELIRTVDPFNEDELTHAVKVFFATLPALKADGVRYSPTVEGFLAGPFKSWVNREIEENPQDALGAFLDSEFGAEEAQEG